MVKGGQIFGDPGRAYPAPSPGAVIRGPAIRVQSVVISMDDPAYVDRQYRTEHHLAARTAVWRAGGQEPWRVALRALVGVHPRRALEVGCGQGAFATQIAATTGAVVVASDLSRRMVAIAARPPVHGLVADVQDLPFADGGFDAGVAVWMLYHVPDLDRGLDELARVIRPGGVVICATNGDGHLAELWRLVGTTRPALKFNRANGREILGEHFRHVDQYDIDAEAVFETREEVVGYLGSIDYSIPPIEAVPMLTGPFVAHGEPTVFVATR